MKYRVNIVSDAEEDLVDIFHYVSQSDSIDRADHLLRKLEETCLKLESLPKRGRIPPELERIGVMDYREILTRPYRIIYEIIESEVYIHAVLDGRRDIQELLEKRLLR